MCEVRGADEITEALHALGDGIKGAIQ